MQYDSMVGKFLASLSGVKPAQLKRDPKLEKWIEENMKPKEKEDEKLKKHSEAHAHG